MQLISITSWLVYANELNVRLGSRASTINSIWLGAVRPRTRHRRTGGRVRRPPPPAPPQPSWRRRCIDPATAAGSLLLLRQPVVQQLGNHLEKADNPDYLSASMSCRSTPNHTDENFDFSFDLHGIAQIDESIEFPAYHPGGTDAWIPGGLLLRAGCLNPAWWRRWRVAWQGWRLVEGAGGRPAGQERACETSRASGEAEARVLDSLRSETRQRLDGVRVIP